MCIRDSFKGTFGSLVVAHEHEALLRMKPSRNTRLFAGDRVWLVGDPARAAELIGQAAILPQPPSARQEEEDDVPFAGR